VATVSHKKVASGRTPKKCKFAEQAGCTGSHPPWLCRAFGDKTPEERKKIIVDNKLCPFCLLHSSDEDKQDKVSLHRAGVQGAAEQVAARHA
jgi:hypothetical protein